MQNQLYDYCKIGDLDKTKKLISLGANFRANNDHAFCVACENGHLDVAQYLVGLGADFRASLDFPVYIACENGHLDVAQYLVGLYADINVINDAIVGACLNGHLSIVQYLISLGIEIHIHNDEPVRLASKNGHLNIVKYLVDLGANFRAKNNQAVRKAHKYGHPNVVQYLISLGAYHPDVKVNFEVINNLYSYGYFDIIHKLIHNNNITISDDKIEQFNSIKNSVRKIIESRKLNTKIFNYYTDLIIKSQKIDN